jgi:hypothetical protein
MIKSVKLIYDFSTFLNADYSLHQSSCVDHQIHKFTDIHDSCGGFPSSYCVQNTIIHQLWWTSDQVDYVELGDQLNMEVITVSAIMQPPGCAIPLHMDTFSRISKKYPERTELTVRANIYLEDWKLGQFIQYQVDDRYETSIEWAAGDGFMWDSNVRHLSANAGMQNKYTLQVSGFLK